MGKEPKLSRLGGKKLNMNEGRRKLFLHGLEAKGLGKKQKKIVYGERWIVKDEFKKSQVNISIVYLHLDHIG